MNFRHEFPSTYRNRPWRKRGIGVNSLPGAGPANNDSHPAMEKLNIWRGGAGRPSRRIPSACSPLDGEASAPVVFPSP